MLAIKHQFRMVVLSGVEPESYNYKLYALPLSYRTIWQRWGESNPLRVVLETTALPLGLNSLTHMEPRDGIEPSFAQGGSPLCLEVAISTGCAIWILLSTSTVTLGMGWGRELNPYLRSHNPPCYHYTIPTTINNFMVTPTGLEPVLLH